MFDITVHLNVILIESVVINVTDDLFAFLYFCFEGEVKAPQETICYNKGQPVRLKKSCNLKNL